MPMEAGPGAEEAPVEGDPAAAMGEAPLEEAVPGEDEMPTEEIDVGGGGNLNGLPDGVKKESVAGALLLFYTAVEVIMNPKAKEILMPMLEQGNLFSATRFALDQAIKNHNKKEVKMTAPMVVASGYYTARFLASIAQSMGVEMGEDKIKEATVLVMDHNFGSMKGAHTAERQKGKVTAAQRRREAEMAQQAEAEAVAAAQAPPAEGLPPEGPPPGGVPAEGGMMPTQAAPPQGGMM